MRRRVRETDEFRWFTARAWTTRWYPQGVDVGSWRGRRTLAVSWFRQDRSGSHLASRVVLIDLQRSRHIDIALAIEEDGELQPARIHTGGIAWFGDRLFAAATGQGIWEFDLGEVCEVRGAVARRLRGISGRRPGARSLVAVRTQVHPVALRCSFLGRLYDEDGTPLPRVLIGEFRADDRGRIGEFALPEGEGGRFEERDRFAPGIGHMQGAVRWGDRVFVSQSDGMRPGTLWSGPVGALAPHPTALPVGCEDLALDPEARMLWSLGEHPRRRVVRGIPFARIGLEG